MRALMLILDGLGDRQSKKLNWKTPLEAARTSNLDKAAKTGETGVMYTIAPGIIPGSDTAHLALFGYDPVVSYAGRGYYEALGAGLAVNEKDIALRTNFATVEGRVLVDRRAGRNDFLLDDIAKDINGMKIDGVKFLFKHTVEHRGALVLRGRGLSPAVSDNDPHKTGEPPKKVLPLINDEKAKRTANVLNAFLKEVSILLKDHPANKKRIARGIPPANTLLLRGPGQAKQIEPITKIYNISADCVAGGALYKGVAKAVGMRVLNVKGATGDKRTNLEAKVEAATSSKADLVFMHVKATDSFSHDKDPQGKKKFIEKVDKAIKPIFKEFDLVFVSGDHTTSSVLGEHVSDPLPILVWGDRKLVRADPGRFNETKMVLGQHRVVGVNIMPILMSKIEKIEKFGE